MDTLLIPDAEDPKQKVCVEKLLLQVSICELHNDLLSLPPLGLVDKAYNNDGKVLLSDKVLQALLPPQLQKMTEPHK